MKLLTKQTGCLSEQAVILEALKKGWGVSVPIGDCSPYDLILDVNNNLIKVQVKSAWYDTTKQNYVVDNRRTKTNRRSMVRARYDMSDFNFAILHISDLDVFYIMPCEVFISYGSEIHLVEDNKRQRKPRSHEYREAWHLIMC